MSILNLHLVGSVYWLLSIFNLTLTGKKKTQFRNCLHWFKSMDLFPWVIRKAERERVAKKYGKITL